MSLADSPRALRWTVYVLAAAAFAIACVFLSQWQFGRNDARTAQLELVATNYNATPVPVRDLLGRGDDFDPQDRWRPVILTGTYLSDQQLLARNRVHGGTVAFEILVPLRLEDGQVFLVDRGWEPPGKTSSLPDSVPAPPAGEVTVIARLLPTEPLPSSGRSAPEGQVPTINLPLIADTLGTTAGDMVVTAYGALVSEDPPAATTPKPLEAPSEDPGPYLSYAVQWILFAVMGFVFIWYVIRSERRSEKTGDQSSAPQEKRRDRDADAEDALIEQAG